MLAPAVGFLAHKCNKYQSLIVSSLILSMVAYTSLLFVPRVILNPRHPQISFDCTNRHLRMEMCADWELSQSATPALHQSATASCNKPKKAGAGNFTNFALTRCNYVCPSLSASPSSAPSSTIAYNSSWYPMQVCFVSSSEGNLCLLHDPEQADRGLGWIIVEEPRTESQSSDSSSSSNSMAGRGTQSIVFDSRFDRWPVINLKGEADCVYQTVAPLIVNHKPYESIQCRPFVHNCIIQCKVNLHYRPSKSSLNRGISSARSPDPCYDMVGDARITFYWYLLIRSAADVFLFTSYNLIDALGITLTNNFDTLYGGLQKSISIVTPLIVFPLLSGCLIDYYSYLSGRSDYAPPFILFDGIMTIAAVLVIAAPAAPLKSLTKSKSGSTHVVYHHIPSSTSNNKRRSNKSLVGSSSSVSSSTHASTAHPSHQSHHSHFQSTTSLRSMTPSLAALSKRNDIPVKNWYIFIFIVIPLTLVSGLFWGFLNTSLYPFYLEMDVSKIWIALGFSFIFLFYLPFSILGKKLVSGVGRLHLVLLGLIFYTLRFLSLSLLSGSPRFILIPLEAMDAFCLPITWIGITSYSHHLIETSLKRPELMSRVGSDPATSTHLVMHYFLNAIHFGVGRVLGSGLWLLWLVTWHQENPSINWDWLNPTSDDFPDMDSNGYRIILRLLAVVSASIALPALFVSHVCGIIIDFLVAVASELALCASNCKNSCLSCFSHLCCCQCTCRLPSCNICRKKRQKKKSKNTKIKKRNKNRRQEDEDEGQVDDHEEDEDEGTTCNTTETETNDHPEEGHQHPSTSTQVTSIPRPPTHVTSNGGSANYTRLLDQPDAPQVHPATSRHKKHQSNQNSKAVTAVTTHENYHDTSDSRAADALKTLDADAGVDDDNIYASIGGKSDRKNLASPEQNSEIINGSTHFELKPNIVHPDYTYHHHHNPSPYTHPKQTANGHSHHVPHVHYHNHNQHVHHSHNHNPIIHHNFVPPAVVTPHNNHRVKMKEIMEDDESIHLVQA